MREQLVQYVNLLFAGAKETDEIRAEILQNTLDRYDDLIGQGKSPEAAYQLAISGIGDISEILSGCASASVAPPQNPTTKSAQEDEEDPKAKKYRAIAISMYILCPVPLFILSELGVATLGLCLTIGLVAAATYVMVVYGKKDAEDSENISKKAHYEPEPSAQANLKKSISSFVWAIGLAVYFILSFATGAWYITWIIFPILGCTEGLIKAIVDLKEANRHEK